MKGIPTDRQKCQLLEAAPQPRRRRGTNGPHRVLAPSVAKDHTSPCLLPRPCPNCGQAGHWRGDCPSVPHPGVSVPRFLLHRKVSQIFQAWWPRTDTSGTSAVNKTITITTGRLGEFRQPGSLRHF